MSITRLSQLLPFLFAIHLPSLVPFPCFPRPTASRFGIFPLRDAQQRRLASLEVHFVGRLFWPLPYTLFSSFPYYVRVPLDPSSLRLGTQAISAALQLCRSPDGLASPLEPLSLPVVVSVTSRFSLFGSRQAAAPNLSRYYYGAVLSRLQFPPPTGRTCDQDSLDT